MEKTRTTKIQPHSLKEVPTKKGQVNKLKVTKRSAYKIYLLALTSTAVLNSFLSFYQELNELKMKVRKLEDDLSTANKNLAEKEDEVMELEEQVKSLRSYFSAPMDLSERK